MSGLPNTPLQPLPPGQTSRLLDDVIFARVAELIDLPRLYDLESTLAAQIDNLGVPGEHARAVAKAMVDRALLRVARTSRKWTRWASPARPDDACDICGSSCEQAQSADR